MKYVKIIFALVVLLLILLSGTFFTLQEGQKGLVLVMGKLSMNVHREPKIYGPGLHVKWPFISSVKVFDARVHGFASGKFSALTSKQTSIEIEYYVKWKIADLALYYQRTSGLNERAESLMEQKINDELRGQIGKHTSSDVISDARQEMLSSVLGNTRDALSKEYGVEILDIQLEAVKLPARVLASVFKRMAAERTQFANNKRAEGTKVAESIRATADQEVVVIRAQALQEAAVLKAEGEEKAAKIYANSFGKDIKFYNFYRSLQAYRQSFKNKDDILVISPKSQFFNYFDHAKDPQP